MKYTIFNRFSIKARVTIYTLTIFIFSIWMLELFISKMLQSDMQQVLSEQQFSTASFIAEDVNQHLDSRLNVLEKATKKITQSMLLGSSEPMQKFLQEQPALQTLFNGGVIIYRLDGTAVADSMPESGRIGFNYIDIETIAIAIKDGKSNIGQPVIGKKIRAPVFGMTVPIRDGQGKIIGAISGVTKLELPNFLDKLTNSKYGKTGGYLLISPKQRIVITATNKERIMSSLPDIGVSSPIDRFIDGYEGSIIFSNPVGEMVLLSVKSVPIAGWYVGVQILVKEAFNPIFDMQKRMLWAAALLTFLAGGLTWWMLRQQLAPILYTVKFLAHLSELNQPLQTLPITSNDEIGELIIGFNRLLEKLMKRENSLKESESRQRAIIDNEPECIKIVDERGRLVQVNPAGLRMIEADTLQQVIGRAVADLIVPEHRQAFAKMHQRVLSGETVQLTFEIIGLKGGRRWMETHAAPIQENGQTVQLAITRDITERKQSEVALQQQTEALARSNTELEQFSYIASHDLRQPLRMVSSYVQLLERRLADKLDDDTRQMMHFASDGAKRMDQMLVSLLEYSRVGRNGQPMVLMLSLDGVEEALRFMAPVINEANAVIKLHGNWPEIFASRDEFTRLWQNLIGNAVKYRAADCAPVLEITVAPKVDGWRFCIFDNGIGINPSQFDRLFQVFQRLHTNNKYEGTGIGLAIARKIVERHGGKIWVESNGLGQGCHFYFDLPTASLEQGVL